MLDISSTQAAAQENDITTNAKLNQMMFRTMWLPFLRIINEIMVATTIREIQTRQMGVIDQVIPNSKSTRRSIIGTVAS